MQQTLILILSNPICGTTIKSLHFYVPTTLWFLSWDTRRKERSNTFFGMWGLGGLLSSLTWTKEEIDLLSGERSRTVLEFLSEKKIKREKSLHLIFLYHLASSSDLSSISKRSKVIEEEDQIRSTIRSRLCELTLSRRADQSEDFI